MTAPRRGSVSQQPRLRISGQLRVHVRNGTKNSIDTNVNDLISVFGQLLKVLLVLVHIDTPVTQVLPASY